MAQPARAIETRRYSESVDIGTKLFAKVRASTPPHADELANELYAVQMRLREARTSPMLTVAKFVGPLLLAPSMLFPPLFIGLASASVVGIAGLAVRSSRRSAEVKQFTRNAQVGEARAIGSEQRDRLGFSYLRIEIRDGERTFTARITSARGLHETQLTNIPTLFAPHSNVVISHGPGGELVLGEVEDEPLPRATLRR